MHIFFVFPFKEHSYSKILLLLPLQLYYEKIKELTVNKSGSVLFKQALVSLATDSGLHPLVPYFTYFVADEVILQLYLSYCLFLAYFC
jgi:transcription initiation factor TFIID subunit 6